MRTLAIASLLALTGCQSSQTTTIETQEAVYLTTLGPSTTISVASQPDNLRLGAGDALGRAVFVRYVAFVRAQNTDDETRWATAASDAPETD